MQISEISYLPYWAKNNLQQLTTPLGTLVNILQHNSSQASKQPVEEALNEVQARVGEIDTASLSDQQRDVLDELGILAFLDVSEGDLIEDAVKKGAYDPKTAFNEVQNLASAVTRSIAVLGKLDETLSELGLNWRPDAPQQDLVTVRLHFKDDADIRNISDYKKSGSDWYEIARGLTACTGEKPEDVQVIGASNGSVIVVLGTTAAVALLLAIITKHMATVVRNIYAVRHTMEDFRHKRIMNETLEASLKSTIESEKAQACTNARVEVENSLGKKLTAEVRAQLEKAIERIFDFNERGGGLEMITPPDAIKAVDGMEVTSPAADLKQVAEILRETRNVKEEATQLMLSLGRE